MVSLVDLHLHTTASDGSLPYMEVLRAARTVGLQTLAITDHDTVVVLAESIAAGREMGIEVIPGIELSTDNNGQEIHMLGHFIDYTRADFVERLRRFQLSRTNRGQLIAERLTELGMPIAWSRVQEIANGAVIGRPHLAMALVEKGYVANIDEAFRLYLGNDSPAYVDREKISSLDAIALIHSVGGTITMAHPTYVDDLDATLDTLTAAGLDGLECYYGHYSDDVVAGLLEKARAHDLVPTGGSDWHGRDDERHTTIANHWTPPEIVGQLQARKPK